MTPAHTRHILVELIRFAGRPVPECELYAAARRVFPGLTTDQIKSDLRAVREHMDVRAHPRVDPATAPLRQWTYRIREGA